MIWHPYLSHAPSRNWALAPCGGHFLALLFCTDIICTFWSWAQAATATATARWTLAGALAPSPPLQYSPRAQA